MKTRKKCRLYNGTDDSPYTYTNIDAGVASLDRVGLGLGQPDTVLHELTEMIVAYLQPLER